MKATELLSTTNGPCAHFFLCVLMDESGLTELIAPVVEGMGYELWGCEYVPRRNRSLVRVYIDRSEGVTLDDCGRVSHQLSGVLDVEDPVDKPYILEISSPGLDRLLLKVDHFRRFAGEQVKLKLKRLVEGRRNMVARIVRVRDDELIVDEQQTDQKITTYVIPLAAIERARLVPDIEPGRGGKSQ